MSGALRGIKALAVRVAQFGYLFKLIFRAFELNQGKDADSGLTRFSRSP